MGCAILFLNLKVHKTIHVVLVKVFKLGWIEIYSLTRGDSIKLHCASLPRIIFPVIIACTQHFDIFFKLSSIEIKKRLFSPGWARYLMSNIKEIRLTTTQKFCFGHFYLNSEKNKSSCTACWKLSMYRCNEFFNMFFARDQYCSSFWLPVFYHLLTNLLNLKQNLNFKRFYNDCRF